MTERKARVTVTLDTDVIARGNAAVQAGLADSFSAWVNHALSARAAHEARMHALGEAIAMYEAEFGAFTDEEIEAQRQADLENAIRVRPRRRRGRT